MPTQLFLARTSNVDPGLVNTCLGGVTYFRWGIVAIRKRVQVPLEWKWRLGDLKPRSLGSQINNGMLQHPNHQTKAPIKGYLNHEQPGLLTKATNALSASATNALSSSATNALSASTTNVPTSKLPVLNQKADEAQRTEGRYRSGLKTDVAFVFVLKRACMHAHMHTDIHAWRGIDARTHAVHACMHECMHALIYVMHTSLDMNAHVYVRLDAYSR